MAVYADWLCAMIPAPPPCSIDRWDLAFCLSDSILLFFSSFSFIVMGNCFCGWV
jgi:hypothetical protein